MSSQVNQQQQTQNRARVLLVDDDSQFRGYMRELLEGEGYQVDEADSLPAIEERFFNGVENPLPDITLMDVKMPGANGYEVCRIMRENPRTTDVPIIFVSGLSNLDEKMEGYEAGGDDYIGKPVVPSELFAKMQVSLLNAKTKKALQEQLSDSNSVAFEVMKNNADLGLILRFMERSFTCRTYKELGQALFETTSGYGLNASVQFHVKSGIIDMTCDGVQRQLESSLMSQARAKGRIFDFGCRTIINHNHVSLLIRNMPMDDPNRYGTFKDNLCILIDGVEARISGLEAEQSLVRHKQRLQVTVNNMKELLQRIDATNQELRVQSTEVVEKLMGELQLEFASLDLYEEQENRILKKVEQAIERSSQILLQGDAVDREFREIVGELTKGLQD
jgi:DNA-binding response OmpR family regulator